ncbi:threonine synthase [Kribbella sp. NPDC059898]|uniref:threonine synthase n=1 Tax=Kribbella sp. NPDC059898 TaxID=3346995 RepID=UPI00364AE8D8
MTFSALSHLECPRCGATHDADQIIGLCPCGSPLLARYGVPDLKKDDLAGRAPDLWRYHELLPVRSPENVITLGEGMTPLLPLPRYGEALGVERLLMKDEGLIPTGTFKARGAAVGVSRAYEVGVRKIAMPTNGNAGSAWAAYAARAGMEALIAMPVAAPEICRREVTVVGARLQLIDGLIGDAAAYVREQTGYFDASTLKEPYRIEGKKTMGLEIAEQLDWQLPDVIVYPTGGGVGIIGIWKALNELRDLGWINGPLPRLVAVQAQGCAPIVEAWQKGLRESTPWPDAHTVAFGITVPKALGDFLVLQAIEETGGCALAVDDVDILAEQHRLARLEGMFICPEGAANFAAIRELSDVGWIHPGEQVVALNTGAGLKYPETVPL